MVIPSNALYFRWQGRKSTDYGIVVTEMPHIITPPQNYEEITVSNATNMPAYKGGYLPYDLSVQIAYVGESTTGVESDNETWFMRMMNMFFYEPAPFGSGMEVESSNKLSFSNIPNYSITAEIINSIDFTALYRYKTATIVWHCQPYRHKNRWGQLHTEESKDMDMYVDMICLAGETKYQTAYLETQTTFANRHPKFALLMNPLQSGETNHRYVRFSYFCPYAASQSYKFEQGKTHCIGRTYIIDCQKIAQKAGISLQTLLHNVVWRIELNTSAEKYIAYI